MPLSTGFPRQEYWGGLPFPTPRGLPDSEIETASPAWHMESLPLNQPPGEPSDSDPPLKGHAPGKPSDSDPPLKGRAPGKPSDSDPPLKGHAPGAVFLREAWGFCWMFHFSLPGLSRIWSCCCKLAGLRQVWALWYGEKFLPACEAVYTLSYHTISTPRAKLSRTTSGNTCNCDGSNISIYKG